MNDIVPDQDDPPAEWKPDLALRRLVCAANRHRGSGRIICGPRHWDQTMRQQRRPYESFADFEDGFIDQFGLWMTREEAFVVASEKGQIFRQCGPEGGTLLYSEHLY